MTKKEKDKQINNSTQEITWKTKDYKQLKPHEKLGTIIDIPQGQLFKNFSLIFWYHCSMYTVYLIW